MRRVRVRVLAVGAGPGRATFLAAAHGRAYGRTMRDPYAPIPTSERWWARAPVRPPPLPRSVTAHALADPTSFDPISLLDPSGDRLGIDRRRRARSPTRTPHELDTLRDVVSTRHVRVRRVLGLLAGATAPSLVQVVSWCPEGVLARALDPTDKEASARGRAATHQAFRALLPELARGDASPLFAAGLAVLSRRVVRDLAEVSHRRGAVHLVVPRSDGAPALRLRGELAPLTDPHPDLLAIALAPVDARTLAQRWALDAV